MQAEYLCRVVVRSRTQVRREPETRLRPARYARQRTQVNVMRELLHSIPLICERAVNGCFCSLAGEQSFSYFATLYNVVCALLLCVMCNVQHDAHSDAKFRHARVYCASGSERGACSSFKFRCRRWLIRKFTGAQKISCFVLLWCETMAETL